MKLLIPAIASISVVFLWYLKNLIIFGTFTASSWLGMSLARIMPPATATGSIGSFKPIHLYTGIVPDKSYPGIALLHNEFKTSGGFVNFYHIDYVQVSNRFKQDVIVEIKRQPGKYIARIKEAATIYFSPATHAPFLDQNYKHIKGYATYFNADFSGFQKFKHNDFSFKYALLIMLCYSLLIIALVYGFMMNVFNKADKIVISISVFMLLYSIVVGSLIEFGENNRFRFESIAIFLILVVKTMSDLWKYYKSCA